MQRLVLWITEDRESVAAVRQKLDKLGHRLLHARTGLEGVHTCMRITPALILVDVTLPDVDAYAVVATLKTFAALADVPVAVTVPRASTVEAVRHALAAGCDAYLSKPIDADGYAERLGELLRRDGKRPIPTASFLRLQEGFLSAALDALHGRDELAACRERIDRALDGIAGGSARGLLETALPPIAEAIGASHISVELDGPPIERVDAGAEPPGGVRPSMRRPLAIAGPSLGTLTVSMPTDVPPAEATPRVDMVATRLAAALAYAREVEMEQRRRVESEALQGRKDYFLAVLAHELRTPLAPILSAMEIIAGAPSNSELLRAARGVVERQVRYQARLLDDLLDLTRIEQGKIRLQLARCDARRIVGAALEVTRPLTEQRKHRLAIALPDEPVTVTVDAVRMEQVVINLVGNAAKYTPIGGDIAVTLAVVDERAVLTVRDSGEGITADMLDRVFDPFLQLEGAGRRARPAGLGIGLALTRRLVELQGGTVECRSEGIGLGSEFAVQLPVAAGQPEEHADGGVVPESGEPITVLVVEDDNDTRDMLRIALEQVGHQVAVAATGTTAVEQAARRRPDVMLVDLGLPDVDGHEVARRVRRTLGESVYLIALTGFGQPEDVRNAQAAGFDTLLLKPATIDDITRLLAGRRPGTAAA